MLKEGSSLLCCIRIILFVPSFGLVLQLTKSLRVPNLQEEAGKLLRIGTTNTAL